jgi:hypothetical protein
VIVDDAPVSEEPITAQERADLKDEREAEEYSEVYAQVQAEREAAGRSAASIMVAAETMRRLRVKYGG